jgi:hypothetical protein
MFSHKMSVRRTSSQNRCLPIGGCLGLVVVPMDEFHPTSNSFCNKTNIIHMDDFRLIFRIFQSVLHRQGPVLPINWKDLKWWVISCRYMIAYEGNSYASSLSASGFSSAWWWCIGALIFGYRGVFISTTALLRRILVGTLWPLSYFVTK